jgi:hypothetical protein
MKTQEMAATLRAFAELAEAERAEGLRRLAGVFNAGKDEAVATRVNRVLKRGPVEHGHPAELKKSLDAITSCFSASGAKKQASDFQTVLALFKGSGTATTNAFISEIESALTAAGAKSAPRGQPERVPDLSLAREMTDELARATLDSDAFARVVERLQDSKLVSTPTLGAIANQFLGNSKAYRGRKAAIDDIVKRQKLDARSRARGRALDRIGV